MTPIIRSTKGQGIHTRWHGWLVEHSGDPRYSTIRANQLDYMTYWSICVCTNIQGDLTAHCDIDSACTISDQCELPPSSYYMMYTVPAPDPFAPYQGLYPLVQASMEEVFPIWVYSVNDMATNTMAPVYTYLSPLPVLRCIKIGKVSWSISGHWCRYIWDGKIGRPMEEIYNDGNN